MRALPRESAARYIGHSLTEKPSDLKLESGRGWKVVDAVHNDRARLPRICAHVTHKTDGALPIKRFGVNAASVSWP